MTILNEYIVSHCGISEWVTVFFLVGVFGFIISLATVMNQWTYSVRFQKIALVVLTVVFLGGMIASMVYMGSEKFKVEEKYYDVTLDDISAAELLDKYEVVEKNGKIYTIKERVE